MDKKHEFIRVASATATAAVVVVIILLDNKQVTGSQFWSSSLGEPVVRVGANARLQMSSRRTISGRRLELSARRLPMMTITMMTHRCV